MLSRCTLFTHTPVQYSNRRIPFTDNPPALVMAFQNAQKPGDALRRHRGTLLYIRIHDQRRSLLAEKGTGARYHHHRHVLRYRGTSDRHVMGSPQALVGHPEATSPGAAARLIRVHHLPQLRRRVQHAVQLAVLHHCLQQGEREMECVNTLDTSRPCRKTTRT